LLDHIGNDFPKDIIDAGIETIKSFFEVWSSSPGPHETNDDVTMEDGTSSEQQLRGLKQHLEGFRSQIENNPWLHSSLTSL